jgi:hypothetical protein
VGSSKLHLYFSDRDEIWTIGPYNQNHCTNGTMAYWRTYFGPNRYDDTAEKAEEKKFMQGFTTPVGQLVSEETMLVICHAHNTFDKRILLKQGNPMLKSCGTKMRQLVKDKKIARTAAAATAVATAKAPTAATAAPVPVPVPVLPGAVVDSSGSAESITLVVTE